MIGGTNDGFGFVKQGEQGSISASVMDQEM